MTGPAPPFKIFIDIASPDRHSPFNALLSKPALDNNIEIVPAKDAELIVCLLFQEDLEELIKAFQRNPRKPIVICIKGNDKNLSKKVDGWIYGCKLPSRVPTPRIIDCSVSSSKSTWNELFGQLKILARYR